MMLAVVVLAAAAVPAPAEPVEARGKVDAVTLYRGQALVTRVVPLKATKGAIQLVVKDLPERVRPDSLYAAADGGAQVRAVRFRIKVTEEAPRADVRVIEKEIEAVGKDMRKNQQEQVTLRQKGSYVDKLELFVARPPRRSRWRRAS